METLQDEIPDPIDTKKKKSISTVQFVGLVSDKINTERRVKEWKTLGMADPLNTREDLKSALNEIKNFDVDCEVYPQLFDSSLLNAIKFKMPLMAPRTTFIPDRNLIRIMIKSIALFGE